MIWNVLGLTKRDKIAIQMFVDQDNTFQDFDYQRPVGSVGKAPDYRVGGRGFVPQPDQNQGLLK